MNVFLTVGTQLPFDRLVAAVDAWAAENPGHDVLAQVAGGAYAPRHFGTVGTLPRDAFLRAVEAADVVVAHAGIGSLLTALDAGKPLVVMPRRADLGEHRNDHQAATAAELARFSSVSVVHDGAALATALAAAGGAPAGPSAASGAASPELLAAVARFIDGAAPRQAAPTSVGRAADAVS